MPISLSLSLPISLSWPFSLVLSLSLPMSLWQKNISEAGGIAASVETNPRQDKLTFVCHPLNPAFCVVRPSCPVLTEFFKAVFRLDAGRFKFSRSLIPHLLLFHPLPSSLFNCPCKSLSQPSPHHLPCHIDPANGIWFLFLHGTHY